MENKHICCGSVCDRLPPLSSNYSWFVSQNSEAKDENETQIFYNVHDPLSHYHCQIPELLGNRIRGCFYGWVILSSHPNDVMWSLWNPVTSKSIRLPPLIFKETDPDTIRYCCLSSPPDDPSSVLLLLRTDKENIVFCRLDRKRKKLKWTDMSYAKLVKNTFGFNGTLYYLTCSNGKVYALARLEAIASASDTDTHHLVQVKIVVNVREVEISLLAVLSFPCPSSNGCFPMVPYLKGSSTELFTIFVCFKDKTKEKVGSVYLFKLNMISMTWEEMEDLKDTIFSIKLDDKLAEFYSPAVAVASELGGYIHLLHGKGKIRYTYHVKDKTISRISMPCLVETSHMSLWTMPGCRLSGDHEEAKGTTTLIQVEDKRNEIMVRPVMCDEGKLNNTTEESQLLKVPFHLLEMILEFCVGVEYIKFRATSKHCQLAAPMIQWSNEASSKRLQTYSCGSPWLMVFDKHQGIITFTDVMFGDKYFVKTPKSLICDIRIHSSRFGWLLIRINLNEHMIFFNPFTSNIIELPVTPYSDNYCFSSPPTSPDCLVVAVSRGVVWIHFVARHSSWHRLYLNFIDEDLYSFRFITFYGRDLYGLCNNGELDVFKELDKADYSWKTVIEEALTSSCTSLGRQFIVGCDHRILLIIMYKYGESIEVFRSTDDDEAKWEKIDSLGSHAIYICDTTCLCIEAKAPKMANKIYFARMDHDNIVFYSLETCRYHTFSDKNIQENVNDFLGTKLYLSPHTWIEPSW